MMMMIMILLTYIWKNTGMVITTMHQYWKPRKEVIVYLIYSITWNDDGDDYHDDDHGESDDCYDDSDAAAADNSGDERKNDSDGNDVHNNKNNV